MSLLGVEHAVETKKQEQGPDRNEEKLIYCLSCMTSPASIDNLATLTETSSVVTLAIMERLRKRKIVHEKKEYGRGIY
jgi:hypothetical protein